MAEIFKKVILEMCDNDINFTLLQHNILLSCLGLNWIDQDDWNDLYIQ